MCNQVGVYIVVTSLPCRRARALRVGGYGGVSSHFSLANLVCLFSSLDTILTCALHYLGSIMCSATSCASLGVHLENLLYLGTDPSMDYPHHLTLTQAGIYSVGRY